MILREQVFRKMGWQLKTYNGIGELKYEAGWYDNDFTYYRELPPIDSQWEVCAKYLAPFMREKDYEYHISKAGDFWWSDNGASQQFAIVEDDNIAKAACEAFMEVALEAARKELK